MLEKKKKKMPLYRNGRENTLKIRKNREMRKKMCLPGTYKFTRAVDRKQIFFKGGPRQYVGGGFPY